MSDNTDRPVITECRGDHTLIIKLNRPARKNAINVPLAEALAAAFERYDASPELRCAVLTGEGGTFCAGLDLIEAAGGSFPKLELFRRQPRKPLIAAVEGHALAGGFELCLLADLIVASADARMGLPEVRRSLVAIGGGLIRLPRRIPWSAAAEYALTGKSAPATEFHRLGLVNRITERGRALEVALELAGEVIEAAPLAVAATKLILRQSGNWTVDDSWKNQLEFARPALRSEDSREGMRAFAEKRDPVWQAR